MHERTPRSDAEAAPEYFRTASPPLVRKRRAGGARPVIALVIVIVLIVFRRSLDTKDIYG